MPWISVTVNDIDVFDSNRSVIIGYGLVYYDGENLLKPDLISFAGEPLPTNTYYAITIKGEPVLAVLAKTVQ